MVNRHLSFNHCSRHGIKNITSRSAGNKSTLQKKNGPIQKKYDAGCGP